MEASGQLEERARRLAEDHAASPGRGAEPTPLDRLEDQQALLRDAYRHFVQASEEQGVLSGVAEWVLDNFYVVQQAILQIHQNMPPGYYRRLPKLHVAPLQGYPRIYAVAREILRVSEGQLDSDRITRFIRAYQTVRPLTMGELWALPTMLRLSALELLVATVARTTSGEVASEEASLAPPALLDDMPDEMPDETIVAGCIRSLRLLDTQDWDTFFESVSLVEETLRRDPVDIYARMDFDTRDRYRKIVEDLAQSVARAEETVAQQAVRLAQEAAGESRAAHVGFYLLDEGRARLEERLDYRPGLRARLRRWMFDHATAAYLSSIALLTGLVLAVLLGYAHIAGGSSLQLILVALLGLVPASVVAVNLVSALITHTVPPTVLPKLDFSAGVPEPCRTMVVVPALLTNAEEVDFLLRQLELHYLGDADPQLGFALLTDFADAPEKRMPEDEALLERARQGIDALNREYGADDHAPFYLFHRERLWNPGEDCWMGWERKRGKLMEFNRLLRGGDETSYVEQIGDLAFLPAVEYVITLDADTVLPMDAARRLIGTLAHPLNRAEFAPDADQVVAGYTLLQPRTEVKPTSVTQSFFTRVFAGDAGLDLYTRAVSDVYQDVFGEGIYVGKGIYDVDAFERSLAGRVPENALLSHDLFEGIHGRAGLVTDIVLFEDYPPNYLSHARRKHRWVRGDWQLLPWLFPRVPHADGGTRPNDLSPLDRWKIVDNLRRSLRDPALLALLIAGWLALPGSPWVWTLASVLIYGAPLVNGAVMLLARRLEEGPMQGPAPSLRTDVLRWLLSLVFLPYEALIMVDAIATTLIRLTISRKRLLQWTTAAHTIHLFDQQSEIGLLWRWMGSVSVLTVALTIPIGLLRPAALPVAAPLLLAWLASPAIAGQVSAPTQRQRPALSEERRRQLRRLARRTWLYFERFVGPEDHWLPPDHFQEHPRGVVAHRTSPTNIGLMLLSTLSAYHLGYIGLMELTLRLRDAFDSLVRLERYRGHFLNWYSSQDLRPLAPRYVSTVDSGNLAACLIALQHGLQDMPSRLMLRWQRWEGFCDTLDILREVVQQIEAEGLAATTSSLEACIERIEQRVRSAEPELERWLPLLDALNQEVGEELNRLLNTLIESGAETLDAATVQDLRLWSERVHLHLRNLRGELDMMLPWFAMLRRPPTLLSDEAEVAPPIAEAWRALQEALPLNPRADELIERCHTAQTRVTELEQRVADALDRTDEAAQPDRVKQLREIRDWCAAFGEALESARLTVGGMQIGLRNLIDQAEDHVQAMDFGFLFDRRREVFRLGYHVEAEQLDNNHYDLLASEARIASLVAIGKGDVPLRHWLHLNRPLTRVDGRRALLSWNGSMFEYLMPDLLMRNYEETLLDQTDSAAVRCQIDYARGKGVPWGISESGYYRFDAQMSYQYQGFGVPGLGRKRGLDEDLVISPYASLLALPVMPQEVVRNIDRLIEEGMLGHYGFYEAVDYTPARLPLGQERAIVRSYMAHHQGMIMMALTNYLADEAVVEHFHADPRVQSVELLLQEQVPRHIQVEEAPGETVGVERPEEEVTELAPWLVASDAPFPQVHMLSNGSYGVLITAAGGGYGAFAAGRQSEAPLALTRWRADTTLDAWGTWIYVQDQATGEFWSAGVQPTGVPPEEGQVRFYPHQARFSQRDHELSLHTEIVVAPEEDVEIRRVSLTNHTGRRRDLRISSYGEVVLAPQAADRRHPAFNKLFVESEYVPEINGLLFQRRARAADERPLQLVHLLVVGPELDATGAHEASRRRFLGRGRTPRAPAAFCEACEDGRWLTGTTGATLDPVMALGQEIALEPHATVKIAYVTLVAESREEALALARRYRAWPRIDRAFRQAQAQSEVELRNLDLEVTDVEQIQRLLSLLLYPHPARRAAPETLAANRRGQSALWPYAISGDYPILLVRVAHQEELPLVRELLRAHTYWRKRRLKIDLVILNQKDVGYAQELNDQLNQVITKMKSDAWLNRRGGIFLLNAHRLDDAAPVLLETAARVVFDGAEGSLSRQLEGVLQRAHPLPALVPGGVEGEREPTPPLPRPDDLRFDNGLGGFGADGREYVVYLAPGQWTPAPWINVIANPTFGFLVSDAGLGYTWAGNSGENRLTPWRNDPVSDTSGEAFYLRDEETGEVWSPTPLPARADAPYLVRHGAGYSIFQHHSHGLKQRLRLFAASDAPVKVVQLRLENTWERPRRLTATFYAEWVLGVHRDTTQQYLVPEYDADAFALLARNTYSDEFDGRVAFLATDREPHGLTADRTEFLGRNGSLACPAALDRVGLTNAVRPGLDPCAAMQLHLELAPGETKEVAFLLGQGSDREETLALIERYQDAARIEAAWEEATQAWDERLSTVTVDTPDPAMDYLLNRWLLYQALACRIWGRSALYQSSGAFGFRDQLQDVMALLHAAPELAREHILRAARHQFEAGDVLHWWHPPSGRGVRTRISDDLLWLPYVTAEYVETTGDAAILSAEAAFRRGEPLPPDEEERYGYYERTEEQASLYDHCCRALDQGDTQGPHGLPLIGAGDWNDGLNRVGLEGRGESIWLGWFLYATLTRFAPLCERMGDEGRAAHYRQRARELQRALEESGWDGDWYRRAYYDDGTPLGSARNRECQIASMAQSWAVLSGAGDQERTGRAMASVARRLVREDDRLVLLFTPPFDETPHDPGYIRGYPPGVRENGGQYTHAALWAVWAYTELGQGDRAGELFRLLNPVYHSDTSEKAARYVVEPYVVAADVYSAEQHRGHGGWTWYTGSSGWMYRLGVEAILGLRKRGETLHIEPCIPADWSRYALTYRHGETVYHIEIENPDGVQQGVAEITLDGERLPELAIPLADDGATHQVRVRMGA